VAGSFGPAAAAELLLCRAADALGALPRSTTVPAEPAGPDEGAALRDLPGVAAPWAPWLDPALRGALVVVVGAADPGGGPAAPVTGATVSTAGATGAVASTTGWTVDFT
jgi:hypothetical protein